MQSGTTENVKLDRRWYDPADILALDATYNLIYGERGNGKTFSICHLILDAYLSEGLPSAYVRRLDEMIKQGNLETLFSAPEHLKFIEEKTEGKYNFVKYQFHGFYLQKRDPVTNALLAKDPQPFCRTYALSTSETTKGADRGRVKYVFFDEFITRAFYLTNEIVLFESTLESIIRKRPGVKIFMVANTVNKHCPYFKHMGLTNVKKQQQGTIDQYLLGKAGIDECYNAFECSILIRALSRQGDGHALGNAEREHAEQALGVDLAVALFHPNGASIAVRLLDKEGSGSGMQTAGVGDDNLGTFHGFSPVF